MGLLPTKTFVEPPLAPFLGFLSSVRGVRNRAFLTSFNFRSLFPVASIVELFGPKHPILGHCKNMVFNFNRTISSCVSNKSFQVVSPLQSTYKSLRFGFSTCDTRRSDGLNVIVSVRMSIGINPVTNSISSETVVNS